MLPLLQQMSFCSELKFTAEIYSPGLNDMIYMSKLSLFKVKVN